MIKHNQKKGCPGSTILWCMKSKLRLWISLCTFGWNLFWRWARKHSSRIQMQNGLKIMQCCEWFAPWYAKNTSCLERLCDAKILNCDKSKNILRNGQKFHVGIVIVREGQGREGWPIFRWSDAISSLLVISNTFALPPLQTICEIYFFAINLLCYSIQRAFDILFSIE